jgi:hypothetical protein
MHRRCHGLLAQTHNIQLNKNILTLTYSINYTRNPDIYNGKLTLVKNVDMLTILTGSSKLMLSMRTSWVCLRWNYGKFEIKLYKIELIWDILLVEFVDEEMFTII